MIEFMSVLELCAGRAAWAAAFSLLALGLVSYGATLQVGPGRQYKAPCAAFAAAAPGDTIEIDAATYAGDVCTLYADNLTIRGVGGRPKIDAAGRNAAGKGTWVLSGKNTVVENIEFTEASVPDRNGSGIRLQADNLTVRNCYFHDNENGILTGASAASEILIEYSEFGYNGAGDGYSHNMYIGNVAKFTLRYCYSHHARTGHLVKSRAAVNQILYNRLSNEATGTASYELDLPNGGESYVIGNLIEQGPATENSTILTYREEGASPSNPSTQLFVVNNTFVNDRPSGGTFIRIDPSVQTPAVVVNNIFAGPGTLNTQASAVLRANLDPTGPDPLFADRANLDYHLMAQSPAIDTGVDPGAANGHALAPVAAYIHPACGEGRKRVGNFDIGAYEFLGAAFNPEAPPRCRMIRPGGIVNGANFQPGPLAPGSIFSIFGSNLAASEEQASLIPLPLSLVGASVTVNGLPAPLYYVGPSQINAQAPFESSPGPANLVANAGGVDTASAAFTMAAAAPAIFVDSGSHAIAQNQDLSLNTSRAPAKPGTLITAYLTGQGVVNPSVATGAAAPAGPLAWASLPYSATVGGEAAKVHFLGLTPGLVGLLQANIEVPPLAGRSSGDYPLVVTVGGVASKPAALSVSLP